MRVTHIKTFVENVANDTSMSTTDFTAYSSRVGSVNASVHIGSPDVNTVTLEHVDDALAHWVSMRNNQGSDLVLFVHHERGSIETARQLALALLNACAGAEEVMRVRAERYQGDLRPVE